MQKEYIFVFRKDNGEIGAATKADIDKSIESYERTGLEIDFKTIGKLERPRNLDFSHKLIEWFVKEDGEDYDTVSQAVLSIINELKYGQTNYAGKSY